MQIYPKHSMRRSKSSMRGCKAS